MSLSVHADAARILAAAIANRVDQMGDRTGILSCLADAYADAASQMDALVKADAEAHAKSAACTIDHRSIGTPTCPACGARKK